MDDDGEPQNKRPRQDDGDDDPDDHRDDYSSQEAKDAPLLAWTPQQQRRTSKQAHQILRLKKSGVPDLVLSAGKRRLKKGKGFYMWRDEHCTQLRLLSDVDDDVSADEDALENMWENLKGEERAEWTKKSEKMPPLQFFVLVASLQLCTESHLFHAPERELKKEERAAYFGLGKAIAVVRVNDDATLADAVAKGWGHSPWAVGPYCYHLTDVHVLKSPVPIKGALGAYHLSFTSRFEIISQLPLEHSLRADPQVYHDLRGLSIKQPWLQRIIGEGKDVENRSRSIFTSVREAVKVPANYPAALPYMRPGTTDEGGRELPSSSSSSSSSSPLLSVSSSTPSSTSIETAAATVAASTPATMATMTTTKETASSAWRASIEKKREAIADAAAKRKQQQQQQEPEPQEEPEQEEQDEPEQELQQTAGE